MTSKEPGYDPRTGTFRSYFDWDTPESLQTALVRTVAVAEDTPIEELEPIRHCVDVDAVGALFEPLSENSPRDGGCIQFEYHGHEVTVRAGGEIEIDDPRGERHDASNVLLLASERSDSDRDACVELLRDGRRREGNVLGITFGQSAEDRLEDWKIREGALPASVALVDVGATTRSADGHTVTPGNDVKITALRDGSDVDQLGDVITRQIGEWRDGADRTAVCFHSLTALFERIDAERAFGFLRAIADRVEADGACAHYHLDPGDAEDETIERLGSLFDAVVDRRPGASDR